MARMTLYLSESELRSIKALAADVPLSKWCKKRLLERIAVPQSTDLPKDAEANRVPDVPEDVAIRAPEGREPVSAGAVPRTAKASTAKRLREEIPELKPAAEVPEEETRSPLSHLPVVGEQMKAKPGAKTCAHGTAKGDRCGFCGGLAKIESVT